MEPGSHTVSPAQELCGDFPCQPEHRATVGAAAGQSATAAGCPRGGQHVLGTEWYLQPHLLAATVEGFLQKAPCLGHMALLQQWKIVWVLEGDLQLAVLRLL